MADGMRYVFKVANVPLIQSPDGTMRDSVMITEDTCGSDQYTAGLFWVRPGTHGHSDVHPAQDEVYYIIAGRGVLHLEGVEHRMEAGDVVFVPRATSTPSPTTAMRSSVSSGRSAPVEHAAGDPGRTRHLAGDSATSSW